MTVFVDFLDLEDLANHRQDVALLVSRKVVKPFAGKAQQPNTRADMHVVSRNVLG